MEVREVKERITAVIRTSTPIEKLSEVMGRCYGEIMGCLGPRGVQPSGPPFAVYHNMDMSNLDVEIGFPVSQSFEGDGSVQCGRIPGGKAAVTLYVGPYDKIEKGYNDLTAYVKEKGLEIESFTYEFYINDPATTSPDKLETEIYFPVKQ